MISAKYFYSFYNATVNAVAPFLFFIDVSHPSTSSHFTILVFPVTTAR